MADQVGAANCTAPPGAHSSVGKFLILGASEAWGGGAESSTVPKIYSPLLTVAGSARRVNLPYSTGLSGYLARKSKDPGTGCSFLVNSRMDFSNPSWAPSSPNQRLLQKGDKSVLKKASLSRGHLRSLQEPSTAWLTHSRERTDPNTHGLEAGQQQIKNSPFQEAKVQILPTASAGKHRSPRSERLTMSLATAQRSKEGAVTSPLLQGSDPPPFSEGCSL